MTLAHSPPSGTKARRTHDALLEATERCLDRGGYPGATTTAIASAAGVSTGTFYVYFDDREHVLAVLLARRLQDLLDDLRHVLTTDALLDDGLEVLLRRALGVVLGTYRAHSAAFRASLVQLPSSDRIRAAYWDAHEATKQMLVTFLRRAQAAGKVGSADPDVLADTLLVVVQGANNPLLLADPDAPRTRAVVAELAGLLVDLLRPRDGENRGSD